MKKRILAALLAAMCLGLLAGCGSPEKTIERIESISKENRSEKDWIDLVNAHIEYNELAAKGDAPGMALDIDGGSGIVSILIDAERYFPESEELQALMDEYLLPAPVPNHEPGEYDGSVRLLFDGEACSDGQLYVTVDRNEPLSELQEDLSVQDDGIKIGTYPDEHGFEVYLYTPGTHTVRAFVVKDGSLVSRLFEGTYTLGGADLSDFSPSLPSGEYSAPFELSFDGTDGATVYYTLNGEDPLFVGAAGAVLHTAGKELTEDTSSLSAGTWNICARCITDSGLISEAVRADYTVTMNFDSCSRNVGEDWFYDYVGDENHGLLRFDRQIDDLPEIIDRSKVYAISVSQSILTGSDLYGDNSAMLPAMAEEEKRVTTLDIGYVVEEKRKWIRYVEGKESESDTSYGGYVPDNVGGSWIVLGGNAYKLKGTPECSNEEVAGKVDLLTKQVAIWMVQAEGGYQVMACDPDGGNERALSIEPAPRIELCAVADDLLLYTLDGRHMIYDLSTGRSRENPLFSEGTKVLGYTSSAAYVSRGSAVDRVEIDYSKL